MMATPRKSHLFEIPMTPSSWARMGDEPKALTILAKAVVTNVRTTIHFKRWYVVFIDAPFQFMVAFDLLLSKINIQVLVIVGE